MTFNPNIPVADDSPKNQASLIRTDFSTFASVFSTTILTNTYNHTAVNTQNQGDHETVILQDQVTTDPVINDNFACLYCKDAPSKAGTQPQLFLRIPKYLPNQFVGKNAPNNPIQLTYNQVNTTGPQYQSFLPGGYLLYFGQTTISNPQVSKVITLSPAPTKIIIAIAYANTANGNGGAIKVSTNITSNQQFTIFSQSFAGSVTFSYLVIATV